MPLTLLLYILQKSNISKIHLLKLLKIKKMYNNWYCYCKKSVKNIWVVKLHRIYLLYVNSNLEIKTLSPLSSFVVEGVERVEKVELLIRGSALLYPLS